MIPYQKILDQIYQELSLVPRTGTVANYIPELAHVSSQAFGLHICCLEGGNYQVGDAEETFSIQSISKVLSLALALNLEGEKLWERVDVEPSGDPFNSLAQLEYEAGIPRNPLINSGALVISDILVSHLDNPKEDYLDFVRKLAGTSSIQINERVAASEAKWGDRNRALVSLMKSFGNINNDIEEVLDFYFHKCSIAMSCQEIANTFLMFANRGKIFATGEQVLTPSRTKRLNAIMQTCGFYDEAGEFSFRVGLPGKSGVGGGIVAVQPGHYAVASWSPPLNPKGNSALGMSALEMLTTSTGLSVF